MYCTVWLRLFKILPSSLWWVNSYEILEKKVDRKFEDAKEHLATKEGLAREVGEAKADMIKWIFIFWVGQIVAMIAIVKLLM